MKNIVLVMFPVTKILDYYDSNEIDLAVDDVVVVETESGIHSGIVKKAPYMEKEENLPDKSEAKRS